jgi:para-nitrobenzyl esterase
MSEDCLFLNVWTPRACQGRQAAGDGLDPRRRLRRRIGHLARNSTAACWQARGVVVVSFNYRLGRFGFFAHPALTGDSGGNGNWG